MSSEFQSYSLHLYLPLKNINIVDEDKNECIECICANSGILFVGSSGGRIIRFQYDQLEDDEETVYFFDKTHESTVNLNATNNGKIESLQLSQSSDLLIALCEETLHCFRQSTLERIPINQRWKPISCFALHDGRIREDGNLVAKLCVAYKKPMPAIQFYSYESDYFTSLSREWSLPSMASCINFSGTIACISTADRYCLVDLQQGRRTDLFEFPPNSLVPKICLLKKDEFLLSGPGGLGIYARGDSGASTRPPLQWSSHVKDIVYSPPYLLAVDGEFVTVHGVADQEQKQAITLPAIREGCESSLCMTCSEPNLYNQKDQGVVLLATPTQVLVLARQTWDHLAMQKLKEKRIREVIQTLEEEEQKLYNSPASLAELQRKRVSRVHCLLGYCEFHRGDFHEAQLHFEKGLADVRELLALYPGLLPAGYNFQSSWQKVWSPGVLEKVPEILEKRLEEFKTKHQQYAMNSDEEEENSKALELSPVEVKRRRLYEKYCHFLVQFLEEHRESQLTAQYQLLVETALLKLYADLDSDKDRLQLLIATMAAVDVEDVVDYLEKQNHYHTCALMYRWHGNYAKSLLLWKGLATGELKDTNFPGLDFVIEILCNLEHVDLVMENASWLLKISQVKGIRVFIDRSAEEPMERQPQPKTVLSLLDAYQEARLLYLEYLVMKQLDNTPIYHQMLAEDFLTAYFQNNIRDSHFRNRFYAFLEQSDLYRINQVLDRLSATAQLSTAFMKERALLHGKMNDLTKALRILLEEMKDPAAAELFCIRFANRLEKSLKTKASAANFPAISTCSFSEGNIMTAKSDIFIALLHLYTEKMENLPRYSQHILNFLNNPNVVLNPLHALVMLPEGIPLSELMPFLTRSLLSIQHCMASAEMEVCILENLHQKARRCQLSLSSASNAIILRPTDRIKGAIDNHLHCDRCTERIAVENSQETILVEVDKCFHTTSIRPPSKVTHLHCPEQDVLDLSCS